MAEFKEEELALIGPGFVLTYMDDPLRRQLIRQVSFICYVGKGWLSRDVGGVFGFFCLGYLQLCMKSWLTQ